MRRGVSGHGMSAAKPERRAVGKDDLGLPVRRWGRCRRNLDEVGALRRRQATTPALQRSHGNIVLLGELAEAQAAFTLALDEGGPLGFGAALAAARSIRVPCQGGSDRGGLSQVEEPPMNSGRFPSCIRRTSYSPEASDDAAFNLLLTCITLPGSTRSQNLIDGVLTQFITDVPQLTAPIATDARHELYPYADLRAHSLS
mgnify:CR=1 FL=1